MDIKQIRKHLGLTQVDLAKKLGVAELTIRRWENGSSQPSHMAQKLINEFLLLLDSGRGGENAEPITVNWNSSCNPGHWLNVPPLKGGPRFSLEKENKHE